MAKISSIKAREILDSRGNPTVEVDLVVENHGLFRAAVPSGASTGAHEAHELRDGDKARYSGKGVLTAVKNINTALAPKIVGVKVEDQAQFDQMIIDIDGSKNKSALGANALLALSMGHAKALSSLNNKPVYEHFHKTGGYKLPVPLMNILNGGAHANNGLDVQEFMIAPVLGESFKEALRAGAEVFHVLKTILNKKGLSTAVGDEGGFAPVLKSNEEALELVMQAIDQAGYKAGDEIKIALDVASTELYENSKYTWEKSKLTSAELGNVYTDWSKKYPLISIEDGFSEDDWSGWAAYTKSEGSRMQIVGDDLFVTNPERLKRGIDLRAANALLVKVNQIGTITETIQAVSMAQEANYHTVMSHRSGETEDTMIADLSVALMSEQIKTGSLCRGERIAKYNQLLRIEEALGSRATYWGAEAFKY